MAPQSFAAEAIASNELPRQPPASKRRIPPKHDPLDQAFRRVPMAAASRTIAIALTTNLHLAFDTKLLRTHSAWAGASVSLYGPPYNGYKEPFIGQIDGKVLWTFPSYSPWWTHEPSEAVLTNASPGSRFRAVSTKGGPTTLVYDLSIDGGKLVRVHERPVWEPIGQFDAIVRRFEIEPCSEELWLLAHAERGKLSFTTPKAISMALTNGSTLTAAARGLSELTWKSVEKEVSYQEEIITEESTEKGRKTVPVAGMQVRAFLRIPAHTNAVAVEVATIVCNEAEIAPRILAAWASKGTVPPNFAFLTGPEKDSRRPPLLVAPDLNRTKTPAHPAGDESYLIEHFPVPKEIDLLVGGMDWLPTGDLAICTWPGEVYIVQQPQGPVGGATYRRFARGFNEPLGLKVVNGQIYVMQKCELTRLVDTDGDGEADLQECLNDDWGYTGNYHSFAFGPAADSATNLYAFICGQRGRWDVPYVGWCVRMNRDRRDLQRFCHGLRAPNGFGRHGPNNDLFVTDNQGNWVPACKLNHLQEGRFYGFPSGYPAAQEEYERPTNFTLPAIWFPRALAPSASGIETIQDDRFGLFKGQMLVGDFQNGIVMRVALEKINDEWQGAVWPFTKGFLGAVNRLSFGPDGKLYVGGCKRAWSTASPQEYSLDRVSFTGKNPFEIHSVHARPDGFDLLFTQPVAAESGANPEGYFVSQFNYKYHAEYGSPEFDHNGVANSATEIKVRAAQVSDGGLRVRLILDGWREGYVTTVRAYEVLNRDGKPLRHDTFYYTLNRIPK